MKETNVMTYVKGGVSILSGVGIAAIIGNAVRSLSPTTGAGAIMKLCIGVGTAALSGLAADAGSKYLEERIDEATEAVSKAVSETSEVETPEVVEA